MTAENAAEEDHESWINVYSQHGSRPWRDKWGQAGWTSCFPLVFCNWCKWRHMVAKCVTNAAMFSYSDPTQTTFLGLPEILYVMICHYRPATFLFSSSPISQCHQTVALTCYKTINVTISFFGQFTPKIGHFDLGAWIVHKRNLNDCTPLILKY